MVLESYELVLAIGAERANKPRQHSPDGLNLERDFVTPASFNVVSAYLIWKKFSTLKGGFVTKHPKLRKFEI